MREIFENVESEAVLLVDASNALNSLNRNSALLNMIELCPSFATILTKIYHTGVCHLCLLMVLPCCHMKGPHKVTP